MQQLEKFRALGLSERTLSALAHKGFTEPSLIQQQCIPLLLQTDSDIVGQAQTGTGKTAAFGLPLLEFVDPNQQSTQALVLSPTRELALQVAGEITSLQGDRKLSVVPIYGGAAIDTQLRQLRRGAQIVVGTPGRIIDHLKRKTLNLEQLKFLVLDEADEMLDMGFIEEVEEILSHAPVEKRVMLFSATMPPEILNLAEKYMRKYKVVRSIEESRTPDLTTQYFYQVRESDKTEALCRIIDLAPDFYGLVFCRTKRQCDEVGKELMERGYNAEVLHGDLGQRQRETILAKLRDKRIDILVATDVAARGIDVQDLLYVVNYTIAQNPDTYIHRIGRTGRAGKEGTAITFVTPSEMRRFSYIRRMVKSEIEQRPLPSAQAVIEAKRLRLMSELGDKVEAFEASPAYESIARHLLEGRNATRVVTALLEHQYSDLLLPSRYREIDNLEFDQRPSRRRSKREAPVDEGQVRLFIAKGRKDGLNKRDLVDFITSKTSVTGREINNVQLYNDYAFITVPEWGAKKIFQVFDQLAAGGKPLVTRARPDTPSGKHLSRSPKRDNYSRSRSRKKKRYR